MSDVDAVLSALRRIRRACRQRTVHDPAREAALTAHQADILSHLDPDDPTMVTELAAHVGVTASTMSLTLKRLEQAGYVFRAPDPADRRVTNVTLTPAGEAVRRVRTDLDPERIAAMLTAMDRTARASALEGLARLAVAADALVRRGLVSVAVQTGGEG